MAEQETDFTLDRMGWAQFLSEMLQGMGIALGLALLWVMESVRDVFFGLLDRFNRKARGGKASAFPPGRPRRHAVKQAGS
jgi:hypothetical protein